MGGQSRGGQAHSLGLPTRGIKGFYIQHLLAPLECITSSMAMVECGHYGLCMNAVMYVCWWGALIRYKNTLMSYPVGNECLGP